MARNLIAFARTVPDILWALLFVVSVVLGLVGAGGIGLELKVAMDLFNYAEAATIIIAIFVLVILVERASVMLRRHVL